MVTSVDLCWRTVSRILGSSACDSGVSTVPPVSKNKVNRASAGGKSASVWPNRCWTSAAFTFTGALGAAVAPITFTSEYASVSCCDPYAFNTTKDPDELPSSFGNKIITF